MKAGTIAVIGVGILALMYFGGLGAAGNDLQYYIQTVDFTGLTTGKIVLVVQNPSNVSILLNSMAGTVTVNGTNVGNISNFQGGVQIPANQQVAVNVFVALNLGALISSVYTALTSPAGNNAMQFVIAGNANINAGTVLPFNITQTVNV